MFCWWRNIFADEKKIVAINYDILIVNNINNEKCFLIFLVQAMKQKLINMEKP